MRWPEVVLLLGYAALAEIRLWRIRSTAEDAKSDAMEGRSRLRDVERAAATQLGRPLLRRDEDHDDEGPTDRELRGR